MTLKSLIKDIIIKSTKESIAFLEKCNYPFKDYEYVNNTRYPSMIAQKETKEELQKMIDWCCKNYDASDEACKLKIFIK